MGDTDKKIWGVIGAVLLALVLWAQTQPATPENASCVKVAHDEVCQ